LSEAGWLAIKHRRDSILRVSPGQGAHLHLTQPTVAVHACPSPPPCVRLHFRRLTRAATAQVMSMVTLAAIGITGAALTLDVPYKFSLLCLGLALWGVAQVRA
jgi:hypothetical protein